MRPFLQVLQVARSGAEDLSVQTESDPSRPAGAVRPVERRRFLSIGLGAGVVGALGVAASLGASSPSGAEPAVTAVPTPGGLWRLNPSWGFPASGSGRCECNCNACVRHAANKVFFGRAEAETGRAHLGCVCIAEPLVSSVDVAALRRLSVDGRSVDRRDPAVAGVLGTAPPGGPTDAEVRASV